MDDKLYEMVESFCATEKILGLVGYILVDRVAENGEPYWDIVEKESKIKVGSISRNKDKDKYYVYVYDSPIIDWNQNIPEEKHFLYDSMDRFVLNFGFKNRCGVIIAQDCALGETHDNDMLFVNIKKDDETIGLIQIYFNKGIEIQFMNDENDSKFKQSLEYSCGRYKLEYHAKLGKCKYQDFTLLVAPILEKLDYVRITTCVNGLENEIDVLGTVEDWARIYTHGQTFFANIRSMLNNLFPLDDEKTKNGISYEKSLD